MRCVPRRAAALLLVVLLPHAGSAQGVGAQIGIDALVIGQPIAITTLANLAFGTVLKGVATTVQRTDPGAGEWRVQGNRNAQVSIAFTLPTQLINIQALPGSTMPIAFGATSAGWHRATNNAVAATPFDPNAGTTGRFGPRPNPFLYIWIGGTVSPAATAKPGVYTGTIIVSIAYL